MGSPRSPESRCAYHAATDECCQTGKRQAGSLAGSGYGGGIPRTWLIATRSMHNWVVLVVMTAVDGVSTNASFTIAFWTAIAATASIPTNTAMRASAVRKGPNQRPRPRHAYSSPA